MPPPVVESDAESATGTPAPARSTKVEETKMAERIKDEDDVGDNDDENEDDDDDDGDEEVYIVEKIQDHRSQFEDGKTRYLVKWKGYEAKKDRTWEPEENLEGAHDALTEYWASIGGKPNGDEKTSKKRGRQSGSIKPDPDSKSKKPRNSKGARSKGNSLLKQDVNPPPTVGYAEVGDDDWKPPPVKDGSWDPLVQSVDTVVRENSDGELWGYLIWNDQNSAGRYYRSKAKLPAIYKACPQRMLHFYEKHLVFTNGDTTGSEQLTT